MYRIAKRYTSKGRERYGTSLFIDDTKETMIDRITTIYRDPTIIISTTILLISKLVSSNFLGLVFTVPVYFFMYFLGEQIKELEFTNHRLLISTKFKNPRFVMTFGYILVISAIVVFMRFALPQFFNSEIFGKTGMRWGLQQLGFSDIIIFNYLRFFLRFEEIFTLMDASLTILINLWFGIRYVTIGLTFAEVNLSHIGELLIAKDRRVILVEVIVTYLAYFIIQIYFLRRFSILFLVVVVIGYYYFPRTKITKFQLFGTTSRSITGQVFLQENEIISLSRATSIIFDWELPDFDNPINFPDNIIPPDVVSTYQTGMGASLRDALYQANLLGAIISNLINIIVIIILSRFAFLFAPSALNTVFLLGSGLVILSLGFGIFIHYFNRFRVSLQSKEKLMIGPGFISRFVSPSLWIVKGNKMEGTTLMRGLSQPYFKIDRSRGLIIQWQKLFIFIIVIFLASILAIWSYLGALNLSALVFIFPILLDFGFQFLIDKANQELGFFIISGYVLWFILQFLYPSFYGRSRPALLIELEYSTLSPILMKDFEEHQGASVEFGKVVINSSRSHRRGTTGRPGEFFIRIQLLDSNIQDFSFLSFETGINGIVKNVDEITEDPLILYDKIRISGLTGFPIIIGKMIVKYQNGSVVEKYFSEEILYEDSKIFEIHLESQEFVRIKLEVIGQKS